MSRSHRQLQDPTAGVLRRSISDDGQREDPEVSSARGSRTIISSDADCMSNLPLASACMQGWSTAPLTLGLESCTYSIWQSTWQSSPDPRVESAARSPKRLPPRAL